MTFPLWAKEARPGTILGPQEKRHEERFLQLYVDIVRSHAVDPNDPTMLELLGCRSIAAAVWRMFAWTDDAQYLEEEVWGRASWSAARRSEWANQDHRSKMVRLSRAQVDVYRDTMQELRNGLLMLDEGDEEAAESKGKVIHLKKKAKS